MRIPISTVIENTLRAEVAGPTGQQGPDLPHVQCPLT